MYIYILYTRPGLIPYLFAYFLMMRLSFARENDSNELARPCAISGTVQRGNPSTPPPPHHRKPTTNNNEQVHLSSGFITGEPDRAAASRRGGHHARGGAPPERAVRRWRVPYPRWRGDRVAGDHAAAQGGFRRHRCGGDGQRWPPNGGS